MDLADYLKTKPGFEKCLASNSLDISALKNNPTSPEAQCFAKCMMEEKGVLDGDGNVQTEQLVDDKTAAEMMPEQMESVEKMKECLKNVVIKECEDILQFVKCSEDISEDNPLELSEGGIEVGSGGGGASSAGGGGGGGGTPGGGGGGGGAGAWPDGGGCVEGIGGGRLEGGGACGRFGGCREEGGAGGGGATASLVPPPGTGGGGALPPGTGGGGALRKCVVLPPLPPRRCCCCWLPPPEPAKQIWFTYLFFEPQLCAFLLSIFNCRKNMLSASVPSKMVSVMCCRR
nr:unnamed protein product [Callosobruchus chinensis]